MMGTTKSSAMVETSELYLIELPSSRWAIFFSPSMRMTEALNLNFSWGSVLATAFQIPPVPSWAGKRKVALGPLRAHVSWGNSSRPREKGAPVAGSLLVENVADDELEARGSDALSEPLALHLLTTGHQHAARRAREAGGSGTRISGRRGPNLEVVGSHEEIGETGTCKNSTHFSSQPFAPPAHAPEATYPSS